MAQWEQAASLAVGGLVAIAFWDEATIAIGSHSGLGLVDARTGVTHSRTSDTDGTYAWYQADPPSVRRDGPSGGCCSRRWGYGAARCRPRRMTAGQQL